MAPLLLVQGSPTIVRSNGHFSCAEEFQEGKIFGGFPIKIIGFNFIKHFYDQYDHEAWSIVIAPWSLQRIGVDREILQALGGDVTAALTVSQTHAAIDQTSIEPIVRRSLVSYCYSSQRHLWALNCILDVDRSWIIGAVEVPHEHFGWNAGSIFITQKKRLVVPSLECCAPVVLK